LPPKDVAKIFSSAELWWAISVKNLLEYAK